MAGLAALAGAVAVLSLASPEVEMMRTADPAAAEMRHCGVNAFDKVQVDGAWKVANLSWMADPGARAELGADRAP